MHTFSKTCKNGQLGCTTNTYPTHANSEYKYNALSQCLSAYQNEMNKYVFLFPNNSHYNRKIVSNT